MFPQRSRKLLAVAAVFLAAYFVPIGWGRFDQAVLESLRLVRSYAQDHVLGGLVPALLVAGAITAFIRPASITRFLGARANPALSYAAASVGGTILAVCSCTVLPLFAGVYRLGAGLGPACTFLYAGPAVSVMALLLTARVLGPQLGLARAIASALFGIVIGLLMHLIFRKQEAARAQQVLRETPPAAAVPAWQTLAFFVALAGVVVFANWSITGDYRAALRCCPGGHVEGAVQGVIVGRNDESITFRDPSGQDRQVPLWQLASLDQPPTGLLFSAIHRSRFVLAAAFAGCLVAMLVFWFKGRQTVQWLHATGDLAAQILPLLLAGVLVAGFLLGRDGNEGLVPPRFVQMLLGHSPDAFVAACGFTAGPAETITRALWPLWTNLFAALLSAVLYLGSLTEVPLVQGLLNAGMGKGPALALLLAGPAISLPSLAVLTGLLGLKKTFVYCSLAVATATASGLVFGWLF